MKKFFEGVKIAEILDSSNITGAGVTGSYHPVSPYRRAAAFMKTGTIAEGKKATITLMQATSAAGAGAKVLKTLDSAVAGVGGTAFTLSIEAVASELDLANGYAYVALKMSSDDTVAVGAAGALLLTEARFEPVS